MSNRTGQDGLDHSPVQEPRPGFAAEALFTSMWAELMNAPREDYDDQSPLEIVLANYRLEIGQREATVAASVIGWLGCNLGQGLLLRAHELAEAWEGGRSEAYVMAWTYHNMRVVFRNNGIRTLEFIMIPSDQPKTYYLSAEDYEVAEMVWSWLGSSSGQAFLQTCEDAVKEKSPAPGVFTSQQRWSHAQF